MGALLVFIASAGAALSLWGAGGARLGLSPPCSVKSGSAVPAGKGILLEVDAGRWEAPAKRSTGVTSVPLLLELLGAALDAGLTVQGALHTVAGVSGKEIRESLLRVAAGLEIGASWRNAWEGNLSRSDVAQIHHALTFGALTGAPAAPLLYAEAQRCRTAASRYAEKRSAALGVKLVVPLGLCSLPAFIALGIVPVVMAMIVKL